MGSRGAWHLPPERQGHDGQRGRELSEPRCPCPTPALLQLPGDPALGGQVSAPRTRPCLLGSLGPAEDVPDTKTSRPYVSAVSGKLGTISPHCFLFRLTDLAGCCPGNRLACVTAAQRGRQANLQPPPPPPRRHKGLTSPPVGGGLGPGGGLSQALGAPCPEYGMWTRRPACEPALAGLPRMPALHLQPSPSGPALGDPTGQS